MDKPSKFGKGAKDENDKAHLGEGLAIHWRLPQWFPELSAQQLGQFKVFHEELLKANKSMNLIGVKTISHADAIHFADCILASREILKIIGKSEVFDIGVGNGLPGLIMSILSPTTQTTLVVPDPKRAEFVSSLARQFALNSLKVVTSQIDKLPEGSMNFVVCRGLASISRSILVLRKPVKKGGVVFHMKGEEWFKEVSEIPTQLCSYWRPALMAEYRLPIGEMNFSIVRTDKFSE